MIFFQPSASEVHARAGKWFDDEEIYQWFAANLHRVREPSLRHYVRAKELKAAGMDWTAVLAAEDENPRARLAAELLANPAYGSTAARVKAFVEQQGGCRATFFNYRKRPVDRVFKAARGRGIMRGVSSFFADAGRGARESPELLWDGEESGVRGALSPSRPRRPGVTPASGRAATPRSAAPGAC